MFHASSSESWRICSTKKTGNAEENQSFKSALAIEEKEEKNRRANKLALTGKKREEEAHLEFLLADRKPVGAAARAEAIDEELRSGQEDELPVQWPSRWPSKL